MTTDAWWSSSSSSSSSSSRGHVVVVIAASKLSVIDDNDLDKRQKWHGRRQNRSEDRAGQGRVLCLSGHRTHDSICHWRQTESESGRSQLVGLYSAPHAAADIINSRYVINLDSTHAHSQRAPASWRHRLLDQKSTHWHTRIDTDCHTHKETHRERYRYAIVSRRTSACWLKQSAKLKKNIILMCIVCATALEKIAFLLSSFIFNCPSAICHFSLSVSCS